MKQRISLFILCLLSAVSVMSSPMEDEFFALRNRSANTSALIIIIKKMVPYPILLISYYRGKIHILHAFEDILLLVLFLI